MKYICVIFSIICVVILFLFVPIKSQPKLEYLRIHIRANSNSVIDQNVKYKVKDEVVDNLIPLLSEIHSIDEAKTKLSQNFFFIENIANKVLTREGVSYSSHASIKNEFFPTRSYDGVTLKEGYYNALILDLGKGEGNNWWCIIFPAFCFTKSQNFDNTEYISLIWEIIKHIS